MPQVCTMACGWTMFGCCTVVVEKTRRSLGTVDCLRICDLDHGNQRVKVSGGSANSYSQIFVLRKNSYLAHNRHATHQSSGSPSKQLTIS